MKISIMQPYYFPYLGYFQLIKSSDIFVNLDHVMFKKRSYITRNKIKNDVLINLKINNASQNQKCLHTTIIEDKKRIDKFLKTIHFSYSKCVNYEKIMDKIILKTIEKNGQSISEFNFSIIKKICNYLEIKTKLIETSDGLTTQKRENGIIEIVNNFDGKSYINPIGGTEIYCKNYFKERGINLYFIRMQTEKITKINPYLSILDCIFSHEKDLVIENLNYYELI